MTINWEDVWNKKAKERKSWVIKRVISFLSNGASKEKSDFIRSITFKLT